MTGSPYSRTRNRQVVRVLRVIRLLQDGWQTLDALTRELSVTSRTVRRDLAAVEAADLPLRRVHRDGEAPQWTLREAGR